MEHSNKANSIPLECPNCGTPNEPTAVYCQKCSQKRRKGHPNIFQLINEAVDSLFSLNSKIFLTLRDILIPGRITSDWFSGKRVRHIGPFRTYLVFALILFAIVSHRVENSGLISLQSNYVHQLEDVTYQKAIQTIDSLALVRKDSLTDSTQVEQIASFTNQIQATLEAKSVVFQRNFFAQVLGKDVLENLKRDEIFSDLTADEIIKRHKVTGWFHQMITRQGIRLMRNGDNFITYLIRSSVWLIFGVIPLLALLMKVLYRQKNFYYIQHLVFQLITHAQIFILVTVYLIINPANYSWTWVLMFLLSINIFLNLYFTYKDPLSKTFSKFIGISFFYFALALPIASVVHLGSTLLLF